MAAEATRLQTIPTWPFIAESQLQHDAYVHMHGTVHHCAVRMAGRLLILELEAMVAAPAPMEGGLCMWHELSPLLMA